MNKSDIMKAAELAEVWLSDIPLGRDGKPLYMNDEPEQAEVRLALICAAELLKQVEVLPEGSEPMVGDLVKQFYLDDSYRFIELEEMDFDTQDFYLSGKSFAKPIIIQRAGKPVIIEKEGV